MFQQRGMWRLLPQDPSVARMGPSLCALGGSLYLIGGGSELHFQDEDFARADGERYDLALKKWFKIAPMNIVEGMRRTLLCFCCVISLG